MRVVLAHPSGACYGVDRAMDMAFEAANSDSEVHTLGPLIHNPLVVGYMEERGISSVDSIDDADSGTLIIRSHGVPAGQIDLALQKGLHVVDATCPHVKRAQREASNMASDGRFVVIIGESGHPEVEAILSYAGPNAMVIDDPTEVSQIPDVEKIGVVVQTTQHISKLEAVVSELEARFPDVEVQNTICSSTEKRQKAAVEIAKSVDAMIVIGGRISGNTRRLYELCSDVCPKTHHIESQDEIDPAWFVGCDSVGVTAGASTPQSQIKVVVDALQRI